jgi:hypothetical protein
LAFNQDAYKVLTGRGFGNGDGFNLPFKLSMENTAYLIELGQKYGTVLKVHFYALGKLEGLFATFGFEVGKALALKKIGKSSIQISKGHLQALGRTLLKPGGF